MSSPETCTRADHPVNLLLRDGEVRFGPIAVGAFGVPSFRRRPSVAICEPLPSALDQFGYLCGLTGNPQERAAGKQSLGLGHPLPHLHARYLQRIGAHQRRVGILRLEIAADRHGFEDQRAVVEFQQRRPAIGRLVEEGRVRKTLSKSLFGTDAELRKVLHRSRRQKTAIKSLSNENEGSEYLSDRCDPPCDRT